MMNDAHLIRAPQGALAWTADGWLHEPTEVRNAVDAGQLTLVVSDDGMVRGVLAHDRAPLAAVLRLDADMAEVVARLDDLGDRIAGIDTGNATDANELRARLTALVRRVDVLEGRR